MINIIYTIVLFNILIVLFKLFKKYNIDNLQALTINYFTVAIFCYTLSEKKIILQNIINEQWIYYAVIIGCLFITTFYLFAYSSQRIGIAITTISNKMSLIIPVTAALILYPSNNLTTSKLAAFFLAIIGIYLCTLTKKMSLKRKHIWIIICVFIGQGILDMIFNHVIQSYLKGLSYYFFMVLFFIASLFGVILIIIQKIFTSNEIKISNILWGVVFGIPNLYSMIFFVKALNEVDSAIVYSLVSIGIVISSSLLGVLIFKEKISNNNWIGILICAIAIYLLT